MAIRYISPHTTTNGTGTFASPYSFSSSTRSFATGDELRIISIYTSSLWTATVYTASITNNYQMTVTAGGGLGADFVAGDVVYIVEADAYFRLYSKATNVLTLANSTSSFWPTLNTSITTVTLRRVNTASYPAGVTSTSAYLNGNSSASITITDGWVADGVRVTDGSAHSVLYTSGTGNLTLYDTGTTSFLPYGVTCDAPYLFVMPGSSSASANSWMVLYGEKGTYTIGQFIAANYLTNPGAVNLGGASTVPSSYNNITIKRCHNKPLLGTIYGIGNTINATVLSGYVSNFVLAGGLSQTAAAASAANTSITVDTIVGYTYSSSYGGLVMLPIGGPGGYFNVTLTTLYDVSDSSFPDLAPVAGVVKDSTFTLGAGYTVYRAKRVATVTSFTYRTYTGSNTSNQFVAGTPRVVNNSSLTVPTAESLSSWTYGGGVLYFVASGYSASPITLYVENTGAVVTGVFRNNVLIVPRDGTAPRELCCPANGYNDGFGGTTQSYYGVVALDTGTVRTTGPSMKASLTTYTSGMWGYTPSTRVPAYKMFRIPCTAGVAKTVTGYFRYSWPSGSLIAGEVSVSITLYGQVLATQNMTTAANGAWEQFTLNFTPSVTGEYFFLWKFTFPVGGSSNWLDDITIS